MWAVCKLRTAICIAILSHNVSCLASALVPLSSRSIVPSYPSRRRRGIVGSMGTNIIDSTMVLQSSFEKGNEYDGDEERSTSYGNRSLAWANRFRRLLPYEWARTEAMKLGLRSKEEWDDYLQDGKAYQNKYLPNRPDEMYVDDWVSWEEFLGIMRSYQDTRSIVQQVLRIKTMDEYQQFIAADTKRAEGLRIPHKPDIVYRGKGWISTEHFFTPEQDAEDDGDYRCSM